jgi:hypothetical protein
MHKPRFALLFFLVAILFISSTVQAAPPEQTLPGTITLSVEAGFDGRFREYNWMPVIIRASNEGDDVTGRLVVRPETSTDAVTNTFSTPINLPSGGQQTVFLYITARSFATQIRVELISDDGIVLAAQPTSVRSIQPQDRLYVVLTESAAGSVDLSGTRIGGYDAFQANWTVSDLPERAPALDSVDLIMFTDVDSGLISTAQQQALADWVTSGGHLVVTGGPNWQGTAAGLTDLLPLVPEGNTTIDDLAPLSDWLSLNQSDARALEAQTIISTGSLNPEAQTLVSTEDGVPLIARWTVGAGTVDYIAADPNLEPLRAWGRLPELWFTLVTTTGVTPGWAHGFQEWNQAAQASEILPGFDPLPDILPLCGFLVAYIALIGPVNYLVLNRINRREWAWFTIPMFIVLFSAAAWALGFNLRGNEATLNRLAVVQSWSDSERARVDGLIGLLSPRRAQYTLAADIAETLRPIPRPLQVGNVLARNVQNSVDIRETEQFRAVDFAVDASFIAGFHMSAMIEKPPVSGRASVAYDTRIPGQQIVRGSVQNDGDAPLNDPVILARGQSMRLDSPLAPGDVATFDLTLPGEGAAGPSPYIPSIANPYLSFRTSFSNNASEQSVIDILGTELYDMNLIRRGVSSDSTFEQTVLRQQLLLSSLVDDSFQSTGRGDKVYLAGWVDRAPLPIELSGANWNAQASTIYLIELDMELALPTQVVTIPAERFTWVTREYNGVGEIAPVELNMQPGEEVVFRFTPLPGAVLDNVRQLRLQVSEMNLGGRPVPLSLWNWRDEAWEPYQVSRDGMVIDDHERFLGPENAVQVRIIADEIGGYLRIGKIGVQQVGTFATETT